MQPRKLAAANADLDRLSQDDRNWVMQAKDYSATHFGKLTQINTHNVKDLKVAWTFSTAEPWPGGAVTADSPAWPFSMTPLHGLAVLNPDGQETLRPDAWPEPPDTATPLAAWVRRGTTRTRIIRRPPPCRDSPVTREGLSVAILHSPPPQP